MNDFDLGESRYAMRRKPRPKHQEFLVWWQRNAHKFSPHFQKSMAPTIAKLQTASAQNVAGLGDFWSDLRDKLINKASDTVKDVAAKFSENAPEVARAAAEYKLMRENMKRIDEGKPTINASDVSGFGDVKSLLYVGIGAAVIVAFMSRKR